MSISLAAENNSEFMYVQDFNNTQNVDSTWKFTGMHGYKDDENGGKQLELYPQSNAGYNASYSFADEIDSGVLKISFSMKAGDSARHVMYVFSTDNKQYPIISVIPPATAISGYTGAG